MRGCIEDATLQTDLQDNYTLYLRRTNYADTTKRAYLASLSRFLRFYPHALDAVTPEHIERHLDALNVSARTREVELEKLRACFKWAVRAHVIATNPCNGVVRPRWQPRQRPAPTRGDVDAIRAVCRTEEERAFVETFYFTGLRMRELLSVRVRDVDFRARRIRVVGKGGHERTVVYPPRVAEILAPRLAAGPDAWLFPSRARPAFSRDSREVNRMLARLGREAGLSYHLTAHILRHAYFRLLKTEGVPLEVAMRLGGHRSIKTTAQIYGALDTDDLQHAYDQHIRVG